MVAWLVDELIELGHDVTLFASGDSHTRAKLVAAWPRSLRLGRPRSDPMAAHMSLIEAVAQRARDFDLIHFHIDWMQLPLFSRMQVPFLTTFHGRLDLPGLSSVVRQFPNAPFVSISEHQRQPLPEANWLGTIHHGLPPESLQPQFEPGTYLAFLGRLTADKGPETAIEIAQGCGLPLRIAAKIPRGERGYYKDRLAPRIDGERVRLVGEVNDAAKSDFLGGALALLFPIDWPEPFGLVMIEAMACGTPVIAYRQGSVPEVIEDGVTGFIVESPEAAVAAVKRLPELDRKTIRARFEARFTVRRMAEAYIGHYERLLKQSPAAAPPTAPAL